jgi:hypothetical protein
MPAAEVQVAKSTKIVAEEWQEIEGGVISLFDINSKSGLPAARRSRHGRHYRNNRDAAISG